MGVVVLGMHRSGTSAVTTAVEALGVPLGDPGDRLPPAPDNIAGFGESRLLSQNNEMLLEELGGCWEAPPDLPPRWERKAQWTELLPIERQLFKQVHPARSWVWKDPRMCILAPFWFRVLGRDHRIVLVFRHPLGVAASLHRRDGLSMGYALALWERYARLSLASAAGMPVLITNYTKLMTDPSYAEEWSSELADFIRDDTVRSVADPVATVQSVLRHDLRHNRFDDRPFSRERDATPSQRELHLLLCRLEGRHPSLYVDRLPAESSETERLVAEHRRCATLHCSHRVLSATG